MRIESGELETSDAKDIGPHVKSGEQNEGQPACELSGRKAAIRSLRPERNEWIRGALKSKKSIWVNPHEHLSNDSSVS